jgi:DNA-binding Lrp family transcriptional regulator
MLSELLDLVQQGGTRRIADLAQELGTTPELVEVMLEDLADMGFVKRVTSRCSEKCTTCAVSEICAAGRSSGEGNGGQIWVLTEEQGAERPNDG